MGRFNCIEDMAIEAAEIVRPPERITVSEAAEKYRYVNQPGSYVGPWFNSKTPYMIEPMDECASLDYTGLVFVGPAQSAKPISLTTPVATPNGWSTMGDLRIGDEVFDRHGARTRVTYLSPVKTDAKCYTITLDDGSSVVADAEHRWVVNDQWGTSPSALVVVDTARLASSYLIETKRGQRSRYSIPTTAPLEMPYRDLPIDPYLLGAWLGDGDMDRGYLTIGPQDRDHFERAISGEWSLRELKHKGRSGITFAVDRVDGLSLTSRLKELGYLGGKRIPALYLRASVDQRRALLRGLMDTDGHCGKRGRCAFSSSIEGLAEDVYELLVSLGHKPMRDRGIPTFNYNGETRKGAPFHRMTFTVERGEDVFSLHRHIRRSDSFLAKRPTHFGRRFIRKIERAETTPVRCITVDSKSHTFLVGRQMMPTHNTDALIINWIAYSAKVDPADMMVVQTSQATARDFAKRRIERLFRHSEKIGDCVLPGKQNQNVFDTRFKSHTLLTLSWPTINELSGKPIPRLALTDYDRMDQDIDGEGSPFDLARKRTTTFRRFGMTVAESSPGFEVDNPRGWIKKTPHEAPPTKGVLSLYNRGDRRRWYWRCFHCDEVFEPEFSHLVIPDSDDQMEAAEATVMACPICGGIIPPVFDEKNGVPGKHEMNQHRARWVKDGQLWLPDGSMGGSPVRSDIASFWLKGVCATFADWKTLVLNYLKAMEEYTKTGSQEALKTTVNVDQGLPYVNLTESSGRLPEQLKGRSDPSLGEKVVPEGVRYLDAMIDVQKHRFVVQVHGVGVGGDRWIVDRFDVKKSKRLDEDGDALWVAPASYAEDWELLVDEVIHKTYPLGDGSGRSMMIKVVGCDSGGREGVTSKAYDFWRWLRDSEEHAGKNLHRRFHLVKGGSNPTAPRVAVTFPDTERKDRKAAARGEIPVIMINTTLIKDMADAMLSRTEPGGGMVNFPNWLPDDFYTELTVETRTNGKWENPHKLRNESWDLLSYSIAVSVSKYIAFEHIRWDKPPAWAEEWDRNDLVLATENAVNGALPFTPKPKYKSLSELAKDLA